MYDYGVWGIISGKVTQQLGICNFAEETPPSTNQKLIWYAIDLTQEEAQAELQRLQRKFKLVTQSDVLPPAYHKQKNTQGKLQVCDVLDIYYSTCSTLELALKYQVSRTTIRDFKRKKHYQEVLNDIKDLPGKCQNHSVALSVQQIQEIYLLEADYSEFLTKFGVSRNQLKNIKTQKTYKKYTQQLGAAGHVKKYQLTVSDLAEIHSGEFTISELCEKTGLSAQTIKNIQNNKVRVFWDQFF